MYLDNEKISKRQLKRLLVFNLFSVSGLIIPRIAVATASRDGLLSIILSVLFAFVYVLFLMFITNNIEGGFLNYSKETVGKFITFIIGFLYLIKFFACFVFAGRLFGEVIKETLLEDTDVRIIILMLLLISAYSASKGFEVRARITELFYFIVLIPMLIFLFFGLGNVNVTNLLPLFTQPYEKIVYGGYMVFLTFTTLEFLLFSMHFVQPKTTGKFKNSTYHYIFKALFIVGIINVLLYIVTVGTIGTVDTGKKLWSTINMIQIVDLPGGVLQRHDALIISIWMISIFTLTSGFLYYLCMITKKVFQFPTQNYMLLPYVLLLFAACVIPMDTEVYFWYFEKYLMYIGMPQSILLPLFVVLIGKIKRRVIKLNKKQIASSIMILFVFFSAFTLTGCSDMTEIEDRNFIQALGIDYEEDKLTVTYASPDLASYTEQGSSDEDEKEKLLTELTGKDYLELEQEILLNSDKRIDFSHLKVILLGKDVVQNPREYNKFLQYVENKYEIGRNTLVFLSDTSAKDIMKLNSKVEGGVGNYLNQLNRINVMNTGKEEVKLGTLIQSKNDGSFIPKIPILTVSEDSIKVEGSGLIYNSMLVYEIDKMDLDYINIARGHGKNSRLFIEDSTKNQDYVIKIYKISKTIDIEKKNSKPYMTLTIEGEGKLEKGIEMDETGFHIEQKKRMDEIVRECNEYIKNKIIGNIEEIMKNEKIDYMNSYRATSYSNKDLWLKYKDHQQEFLEELDYLVEVNIGLQ